jgi:uncharacterized protein YlaI
MSQVQVQLSLKEIYDILCPQCKKRLKEKVKEKIADNLVTGMLQEKVEA